ERSEDIPDLIRHFFSLGEREGLPPKQIETAAVDRLRRYRWPGNVRELENLVRRIAALYPQEVITDAIIEAELDMAAPPPPADGGTADDDTLGRSVERHLSDYFDGFNDRLPPPGLYHRVL